MSPSAAFVASYHGQCPECGLDVEGQWVAFDLTDRLVHVECPDAPEDFADRVALTHPTCTVCGTNHPGEC